MLKYLKKYWFFALLAPLSMVCEVCMDLIQPRLMSTIVDEGVLGLSNNGVGDLHLIITVGLKMIGFVLLGSLFGILSGVVRISEMICERTHSTRLCPCPLSRQTNSPPAP